MDIRYKITEYVTFCLHMELTAHKNKEKKTLQSKIDEVYLKRKKLGDELDTEENEYAAEYYEVVNSACKLATQVLYDRLVELEKQ